MNPVSSEQTATGDAAAGNAGNEFGSEAEATGGPSFTTSGPTTAVRLVGPEDTGEIRIPTTPNLTGQVPVVRVSRPAGARAPLPVWSILLVIVATLVSFVVVGQLRGGDDFEQRLGTETEGDLARILASLSSESTSLQQELASLKVELADVANSSAAQGNEAEEASAQLNALRVLAGTVPVVGPGIELNVEDPNSQVTYDVLVDAVQELRDAGAEALAVNGRRVGGASAFGQRDDRVTLDGVVLPVPYEIDAIGPAATMEGGIQIPGGTLDSLEALGGVQVDVIRTSELRLPALERPLVFDAARPVEN